MQKTVDTVLAEHNTARIIAVRFSLVYANNYAHIGLVDPHWL